MSELLSRKSKQRDLILKVVKNTTTHPGADWVYTMVRQEIPNISLGTVYRNLKWLARNGLIREMSGPGGLSQFDGNLMDHCHFRCERCRKLIDIEAECDNKAQATIARRTGLVIKGQYLEYRGLCLDCQSGSSD